MELRQHQIEAVDQARRVIGQHGVVYLACEMRVGKSMMALALADAVGAGRVLFVTPKAAMASAKGDFEAMGLDYELTVINRESLHKIAVPRGGFDMVVQDESHRDGKLGKPSKSAKDLKKIPRKWTVLMSGTPSVETASQLFHQFWTTNGRGPWGAYSTFYKWHKDFGVSKQKRIAGGQMVNDYTEVRPEVLEHVGKYTVTMTQSEAGFKHAADVVPVRVDDPEAVEWGKRFARDGIYRHWGANDEYVVLGENPAAVLQKQHMYIGGTLVSDEGDIVKAREAADVPKLGMLTRRLAKDRQYFVSTNYVYERGFIAGELEEHGFNVILDPDEFMELAGTDTPAVLVGSGISLAEGVDLSWMTGSMVVYSQNWSGAKWLQLLERQNNWKRDRPIKVYVLLVRDSVDEMIFDAVQGKRNFNATVYKEMKRA